MEFDRLLDATGRMEDLEARLLSWGVSDVHLALSEVRQALEDSGIAPEDLDDVVHALVQEGLLVQASSFDGRPTFRTRSAEIVRLATRLRQWFGAKGGNDRLGAATGNHQIDRVTALSWPEAATLVGDFRFRALPRRRPRREVGPATILEQLEVDGLSRFVGAVRALLRNRSLSGFQARATRAILADSAGVDRGTVVTAGTGSGKTLAFYLPVLARLLADKPVTDGPTVLAVYPRNELLKDQLQTALQECREARKAFSGAAKQIRIGALYGEVPNDWKDAQNQYRGWRGRGNGDLVCPYLRCPECGDSLLLQDTRRDILACRSSRCEGEVGPDEVALTRAALAARPPDILFISGEMLDRALRWPKLRKVIGAGGATVRYVLLDEIHTYEGLSGAQYGLTLRRWRSQIRSSGVHWVGLSATLNNPTEFFANLAPVSQGRVGHVAPLAQELEQVSKHYTLLLQGDASSQTALLSTSIQALMLFARTATLANGPGNRAASGINWEAQRRVFGSRIFAFADKLDIIRRLHDDLDDAEHQKLAWLREPLNGPEPELQERKDAGQSWGLAEFLGRQLSDRLLLGEVTARSRGKAAGTDVVVASSALEVGYDDPEVGAVLQHKAPRQWASYVQRIGRAGRSIQMRPWAVTVLSEFGRDRLSFQAFEDFLSPVVRTSQLPTGNVHVLKMQAAAAVLDMMAARVKHIAPLDYFHRWDNNNASQWLSALDKVEGDLEALKRRLAYRLGVDVESRQLRDVLWRPPRSIFLEFLPALRRQLEGGAGTEEKTAGPFARYFPQALFKSLNVPEVVLRDAAGQSLEEMPIEMALREFAPFNANKRLALAKHRGHWVRPWLPDDVDPAIDLRHLGVFYFEGEVSSSSGKRIAVYRPHVLCLSDLPSSQDDFTADRSRGEYEWRVDFAFPESESGFELPGGLLISTTVKGIGVFTHASGRPLLVMRFAERVKWRRPTRTTVDKVDIFPFVRRDPEQLEQVAIGYAIEADAVVIRFRVPDRLVRLWGEENAPALPATRTRFFRYVAQSIVANEGKWNLFQVDFAIDAVLCMVADAAANSRAWGPENCLKAVFTSSQGFSARLDKVIGVVFPGKVGEGLRELLSEGSGLRRIVASASTSLWEPLDSGEWSTLYLDWMKERTARTVAGTFLGACQSLIPDFDEAGIRGDVQWASGESLEGDIVFSESEPGGVGLCAAIQRLLNQELDRFAALWQGLLRESAGERKDRDLEQIVRAMIEDEDWRARAEAYRTASTLSGQEQAVESIREKFVAEGVPPSHGLMAATFSRILAPGSASESDRVVTMQLEVRKRLEAQLGFELPASAVAYVGAYDANLVALMRDFSPWKEISDVGSRDTYQRLVGLQWRRASEHRDQEVEFYNPFSKSLGVDAAWLRCLEVSPPVVDVENPDWEDDLERALEESPRLVLRASVSGAPAIAAAIRRLVARDVAYSILRVYLRVEAVARVEDGWEATVSVPGIGA